MKKFILAIIIVMGFGAYAFQHNLFGHRVVAPQNLSQNGTPPPGVVYKDGTYSGPSTDAYYGNIQVQVIISGGKITNVAFLDYPHDRSTSQNINAQAMPYLKQEAIAAQTASVNIVSGATDTSQAFQQSLAAALNQAQG